MKTPAELIAHLDFPLWKADATAADVEAHCVAARALKLRAISVNGDRVELAVARLEDSAVKVAALVGFPFGVADSDVKRYEVEAAIDRGAQEIEAVINLGRLKDGNHKFIHREFCDLVEAAEERPVKIILEVRLFTPEEIAIACELASDAGVSGVVTGTGLIAHATAEEVKKLRAAVDEKFIVKAVGRFNDPAVVAALIEAGATQVGSPEAPAVVQSPETTVVS